MISQVQGGLRYIGTFFVSLDRHYNFARVSLRRKIPNPQVQIGKYMIASLPLYILTYSKMPFSLFVE